MGLPGARLLALAEAPPEHEEPRPTPRAAEGPGPSRGRAAKGQDWGGPESAWRQAGPTASHLYTSDSELSKGSAHLGGSCGVVFAVGDDFDEQGVIVWGYDSPLEGRCVIQADAHALSAPEHLWAEASRVRNWAGSGGPDAAPGPGWTRGNVAGRRAPHKGAKSASEVPPHFRQRSQGHPAFSGCHTVTASFPREELAGEGAREGPGQDLPGQPQGCRPRAQQSTESGPGQAGAESA